MFAKSYLAPKPNKNLLNKVAEYEMSIEGIKFSALPKSDVIKASEFLALPFVL